MTLSDPSVILGSVDKTGPSRRQSTSNEKVEGKDDTKVWKKRLLLLIIFAAFGACFEPLIARKRDYCLRDCSQMPGTCQKVNEEYICVCLDGYTGNHISGCQDIDECAEGKSTYY